MSVQFFHFQASTPLQTLWSNFLLQVCNSLACLICRCSQNTLKIGNESIRVCNSCFKSKSKLTTTPAVSNADSASTASNLATSPPTPSQLPSATSSTDSIPSVTSTTEAHVEQILEGYEIKTESDFKIGRATRKTAAS